MKHHTMILLALAGAAAGAYALAAYGRGVVTGQLAGTYGDQVAKDTAASLSFVEAVVAGARAIAGQRAFDATNIYIAR